PKFFLTKPRDHWTKLLNDADVACMPVMRPGESYFDEHVQVTGMVTEIDDPELGRLLRPSPPVRFYTEDVPEPAGAPKPAAEASLRYPLEGIRVLDLGVFTAGPYGSRILSDLGAEVIKIERPEGDPGRPLPQPFEGAQRGKLDIALDLKQPEAQEILAKLIATADSFHHNMR